MSTLPQAAGEQKIPAPVRRNTVVMGRQDFLSVVFRLIGVELYKIRRRMMSKVLSTIALFIMVATFALFSIGALFIFSSSPSASLPPPCSAVRNPQIEPCLDHAPTQADLAQAEQARQNALRQATQPLLLPNALNAAVDTARFIGLMLIVILAGTITGGEYSVGTIRLMFTRGPTRAQFLLAKMGAILACITLGMLVIVPIGLVTGASLSMLVAIGMDMSFLNGEWILHAFLYLLAAILGLFVYAMIALCLSTLGRATAAGVAGALVWWVLEGPLAGVLFFIGSMNQGPLSDFVRAIPDYFIGNNIGALLQNQLHFIVKGAPPGELSDLHAVLVLAAYLVLFIGLAWWVSERRDVTN